MSIGEIIREGMVSLGIYKLSREVKIEPFESYNQGWIARGAYR